MKSANVFYTLMLTGFFGLFILLMLWPTLLSPATRLPVAFILIVSVTPLLLPLRGMLNRNLKSCAWAAYISLLYFAHGTSAIYNHVGEHWLLGLEICFSLMLFLGAALYARFSKR